MYNLPTSTIVNRVIPKKTLVDKLGANTRIKNHFTDDVIKIEWLAKLAPRTLNVADGKDVHEISVFLVPLKVKNCPNDIYSFIDGLMPRHTLFILKWNEQVCLHLNYKEWIESTSKTDKSFTITKTYRSEWMADETLLIDVQGLNMDAIYESLVRQVAKGKIDNQGDCLREDVELANERELLLKELETLKFKETSEKQPQKKFVLHKQIVKLIKKLQYDK